MYDRLCHNIKFTSLIMASYRRFPSPHYGIIIEVRSTLWHNGILIPRYDSIIKEGFDLTLWHHKMSINMESSAGTLFMSAQDKETRLPLTRARVHTATIPNKTDASVYRPPNTINTSTVPTEPPYLVNPSVIRLLGPRIRIVFDSEPKLWSFPPENTFGSEAV